MPRLSEPGTLAARKVQRLLADRPGLVALDTETTGLGWFDEPFCAQLSWRSGDGLIHSAFFDLEVESCRVMLTKCLRETPAWVGHNLKFDLQKLIYAGIVTREELEAHELHDTEAQASLLWPNERKGLKELAVRVLGYDDTIEIEIKSGKNKGKTKRVPREAHEINRAFRKLGMTKDAGYHWLPRDVLYPYAIKDTEFTLRLHELCHCKLTDRLLNLYTNIEMPLSLALLDMEANGYGVDLEYLQAEALKYGERAVKGLGRLRAITGDLEFNPGSWQQVQAAFDRLGVPMEGTDEYQLNEVIKHRPAGEAVELAETILAYRSDTKIFKTYLSAMLNEQRDGVLHPSFRQHGTRTGRMSSGKDNG